MANDLKALIAKVATGANLTREEAAGSMQRSVRWAARYAQGRNRDA